MYWLEFSSNSHHLCLSTKEWTQAKGEIHVFNTINAVMKLFSDGAVGDATDDVCKPFLEFLSAIVGPACYGEEDLKKRLKDDPSKTFVNIVAPAEIGSESTFLVSDTTRIYGDLPVAR